MTAQRKPVERQRLTACSDFAFANPQSCALFLDVDGTLLELAATPSAVRVPDGLTDLLRRLLHGLDGAVAIITGRLISEIDHLLAPVRLTASGVHGAELRTDPGEPIQRVSPELPDDIVTAMARLAKRIPGVMSEPKGPGLAVHYRLAPDAESEILAEVGRLMERHAGAFALWPGKKIFELIPTGLSKGTALTEISAFPAFRGRVPIMIGDDVGDEPAFAVAEQLSGFGLRVAGDNFRGDDADFSGPRAVIDWLGQFANHLSQAREHPHPQSP